MEYQFSREALPPAKSAPPPPTHTITPAHVNSTFAFLVHDQESMLKHTPPNVDNKPLVRQKRRRTNHEDQEVLEAEFARDPRPDRATRDSIVARISLDHKEVHIWFQNRRQKERRKVGSLPDTRVLESRGASIDPSSSFLQPSLNRSFSMPQSSQGLLIPTTTSSFAVTDSPPSSHSSSDIVSVKQDPDTSKIRSGDLDTYSSQKGISDDSQTSLFSDPLPQESQISVAPSSETTYLGSQPNQSGDCALNERPHLPLKSELRMSFNSSGGACLLSAAEATPSPPRANPTAPTPFATRQSLRRSYSTAGVSSYRANMDSLNSTPALGPSNSQPQRLAEEPIKTVPLLQRQPSGRSRDSRAWAYWCDKSSRDAEAEEATVGGDGNAQHAISLLRSRSSLGGRRTPRISSVTPVSVSTEKPDGNREVKRQRLSGDNVIPDAEPSTANSAIDIDAHAKSRSARKPTGLGIFEDITSTSKPASPERTLQSPAGESDKENWGLERRHAQQNSNAKEKPVTHARRRPALGDHKSRPLLGKSRSALNERAPRKPALSRTRSLLSGEDAASKGTASVDPGDMELGAEALLSLSQGAWR